MAEAVVDRLQAVDIEIQQADTACHSARRGRWSGRGRAGTPAGCGSARANPRPPAARARSGAVLRRAELLAQARSSSISWWSARARQGSAPAPTGPAGHHVFGARRVSGGTATWPGPCCPKPAAARAAPCRESSSSRCRRCPAIELHHGRDSESRSPSECDRISGADANPDSRPARIAWSGEAGQARDVAELAPGRGSRACRRDAGARPARRADRARLRLRRPAGCP